MNELLELFEGLNNVFYEGNQTESFPVDVTETKEGFEVACEIPGFKKEDIEITFKEGVLTVLANKKEDGKDVKYLLNERTAKCYKRCLDFGEINEEKISAKYELGILTVTIKVKEPERKTPKTINID